MVEFAPLRFQSKILHDTQDEGGIMEDFFFKCCGLMRFCFVTQTPPHLQPSIPFLFVRPEFCPLRDLWTPKIRLSSDSASRRATLPLAKSSRYRAASGLSPQGTCAHRAHIKKPSTSRSLRPVNGLISIFLCLVRQTEIYKIAVHTELQLKSLKKILIA